MGPTQCALPISQSCDVDLMRSLFLRVRVFTNGRWPRIGDVNVYVSTIDDLIDVLCEKFPNHVKEDAIVDSYQDWCEDLDDFITVKRLEDIPQFATLRICNPNDVRWK